MQKHFKSQCSPGILPKFHILQTFAFGNIMFDKTPPSTEANKHFPNTAAHKTEIFQMNLHYPKANVRITLRFLNVNCGVTL